MRKIYNYSQFNVNERNVFLSWINDNVIKKLSGWGKEFYTWLQKGLIRTIPSGPNKGRPYAMLFLPENGPIVEQLKNYMSMRHSESLVAEATVPLEHKKYTNVGSETLKKEIMDYFKIKTTIATYYDKPKEDRSTDDPARGMKAKPIFIYGAPGIGKTEIVAQCCDELSVPLLFLDVQFMNPEDFKGVPSVHQLRPHIYKNDILEDPGSGFTRSNPPSVFPRDNGINGRGGIIFMDELNRAQQSVLNTMMQFIQQGRIGDEYSLPNKWCLIGAGNREEDDPDASITTIGTALASRMSIMNYVPNYNPKTGTMDPEIPEWKEWASKEMGIMPELVSYLTAYHERFHQNDPQEHGGGAFPSPRSWTEASKILYSRIHMNGKQSWRDVNKDFIQLVFEKEVGRTAATEFVSYLDVLRDFTEQELNEILINAEKVKVPAILKTNTSYLFGLGALLYNRITDKELTPDAFNKVYNLLKYLYMAEGGDPKNPKTKPTGKGERYGWMYKRFISKYMQGSNTMNHMQTTDNFNADLRAKRSEIAGWATSFNK
jgi:hypothetical protein